MTKQSENVQVFNGNRIGKNCTSQEKNILTFPARKDRLIAVDDVQWKWKCGKGGGVVAYSEHGERLQSTAAIVKGIEQSAFERGQYQRTSDGALKPNEVANWIRNTSKDKTMKKNVKEKTEALTVSRKSKNTMFFTFRQNNTGGYWVHKAEKGIGYYVIVEAHDEDEANERAKKIGLYFNGCRTGKDCSCCGDRWSKATEYGAYKNPMLYSSVIKVKRPTEISVYHEYNDIFIHFLNGLFIGCDQG